MAVVDVVVVAYNSRNELRGCVEPLVEESDLNVVVVDNASSDASLETVADLPVTAIQLAENGGFAFGCNTGWRAGKSPYVLLLNPDARLDSASLRRLAWVLDEEPTVGAVGPKIVDDKNRLEYSQRRFPRLRSTYAQALFVHRLLPGASWTDEVVRDEDAYERPSSPDWISGACLLVRRSLLERLRGLDERFFMYCEDIDLCRRIRDAGFDVRYESTAVVVHQGGASAPRGALLPVLAASRIRYTHKHDAPPIAFFQRLGIGLNALSHMVMSRREGGVRKGHARSLRLALSGTGGQPPPSRRAS
jgi:GT2 family glycosyltransferase